MPAKRPFTRSQGAAEINSQSTSTNSRQFEANIRNAARAFVNIARPVIAQNIRLAAGNGQLIIHPRAFIRMNILPNIPILLPEINLLQLFRQPGINDHIPNDNLDLMLIQNNILARLQNDNAQLIPPRIEDVDGDEQPIDINDLRVININDHNGINQLANDLAILLFQAFYQAYQDLNANLFAQQHQNQAPAVADPRPEINEGPAEAAAPQAEPILAYQIPAAVVVPPAPAVAANPENDAADARPTKRQRLISTLRNIATPAATLTGIGFATGAYLAGHAAGYPQLSGPLLFLSGIALKLRANIQNSCSQEAKQIQNNNKKRRRDSDGSQGIK